MTEYSFIHTIQWQLDNKLLVCHFKKMKKKKNKNSACKYAIISTNCLIAFFCCHCYDS